MCGCGRGDDVIPADPALARESRESMKRQRHYSLYASNVVG
jgi:hypothetical protein